MLNRRRDSSAVQLKINTQKWCIVCRPLRRGYHYLSIKYVYKLIKYTKTVRSIILFGIIKCLTLPSIGCFLWRKKANCKKRIAIEIILHGFNLCKPIIFEYRKLIFPSILFPYATTYSIKFLQHAQTLSSSKRTTCLKIKNNNLHIIDRKSFNHPIRRLCFPFIVCVYMRFINTEKVDIFQYQRGSN